MKTVLKANKDILNILGKPRQSEFGFRLMKYVLIRQEEDGWLLFHSLTRELLLLSEEEYSRRFELPELYEKWFLVPEHLDDMKYADQVRFVLKAIKKPSDTITGYTIFTTTDCNARCFYCYEMGRSRIPMTEETAHKVAAYIREHSKGQPVSLGWFGGEPLYNRAVIDVICEDLSEHGIKYSSTMISNAFLFDDEAVKKAVDLWKLKSVQVTLDGTESMYNRCKAFIYKDVESPFQVVISNIERLLAADIRVVVRMNLDYHNAEDLLLLADYLHEHFAGQKLVAYSHPLFEFGGSRRNIRIEAERAELYRKQKLLTRKLEAYGLLTARRISNTLPSRACMADSGHSVTVLPNGELGLCEHYSEDNFIGHIDSPTFDAAVQKSFRETWEKTEACADCALYPECIRLKKCVENEECFAEMREEKTERLLRDIHAAYAQQKNRAEEIFLERAEIC